VSTATTERPRLLLIDDQPADLRDLTELLRDDFELVHATDGQAGFHRAQALRPDLILLDVAMPGADGHAVCRLLQSDAATRAIPVIFLSGLARPEQRLAGFELGAADYIGKPFHAAEVRARVLVHLRRRAQNAPVPGAPGTDLSARAAALQAAMHYIARHLADLPTVSQIAQRVGTSEQRLLALFREHLGLTVSGFVAEERVRAGCRLLAQTQMSVQDVAFEVGFRSPGNFISAFGERMGLTPKAWRQAVLEGRIPPPPTGSQ
jgi:DNA-binding response OmpR family regulator